jgi:hypothetical protein
MMIFIKVYENMNNYKFDNVSFEYGFKFYIYKYVIQNNYKCDSLNIPPIHVFTFNTYVVYGHRLWRNNFGYKGFNVSW